MPKATSTGPGPSGTDGKQQDDHTAPKSDSQNSVKLFVASGASAAGVAETVYLALSRGAPLCSNGASACVQAQNGDWALPLAGTFAYSISTVLCFSAARLERRASSSLILKAASVAVSSALCASSAYFLLVLQGYKCPYCVASAIIAASVLTSSVLALREEEKEDCLGPGFASSIATLLVVNNLLSPSASSESEAQQPRSAEEEQQMIERIVSQQVSSENTQPSANAVDANALATHLQQIGAKMYAAYWCTHCKSQLEAFGSASSSVPYVECFPDATNKLADSCNAAGVRGFPTWDINGQMLEGERSLEELARISGFSE